MTGGITTYYENPSQWLKKNRKELLPLVKTVLARPDLTSDFDKLETLRSWVGPDTAV